MSPFQIARKAVVSCVSDFAAKGVKPLYCLVSIGLPTKLANRMYLSGMANGFSSVQKEYGIKVIGGDTSATSRDHVIDCTMVGLSDRIVKRREAKVGDLIGVSGTFGHQAAGLLVLLGKATTRDRIFSRASIKAVLMPKARLDLGLRIAPFITSSIDSSDGLAMSLYHLAESSRVNLELDSIPITKGVAEFAKQNHLEANDLALFGGEEFEIVCTYSPKFRGQLSSLGIQQIGHVANRSTGRNPSVCYRRGRIKRRGWVHFRSERFGRS
jgi:thiamine-monophosphate kinase